MRSVFLLRFFLKIIRKCLVSLTARSLPVQVVDLCWGIDSVSPGDHEACEVFLQEIRTCQKVSAGPAFVVSLSPFFF